MKQNNFVKWIRLCTNRPHAFAVFLRRVFEPREESCTCREDETMFIRGNINNCSKCADDFCTLDTHYFLASASTALIGWLTLLIEGNKVT